MSDLTSITTIHHNQEAERCVLGCLMFSSQAYDEVLPILPASAFYNGAHKQIFTAMKEMYDSGKSGIDVVLLRAELDKRQQLSFVGGEALLLDIMGTVPHAAHAVYYAEIVKECWMLRSLIQVSEESIKEASQGVRDVAEIIASAETRLHQLSAGLIAEQVSFPETITETLVAICERIDSQGQTGRGLSTGLASVDRLIMGLQPNRLIVLAARPSMGKTALALNNIIRHQVSLKIPSLCFSLEMGRTELAERLLCAESGVSFYDLRSGRMDDVGQYELTAAAERMRGWPLLIHDRAGITISQLCAIARREHRLHAVQLVVVDYLQLIEPDDSRMPREQQVATITRKLKCLAKDLGVPVLILAQLNREVESREDHRPRMSDIRESGAIEQDADTIMFLYRPDKYDPEDRPGEADLIVAKDRDGPTGTAKLIWQSRSMRFAESMPLTADVPDDF